MSNSLREIERTCVILFHADMVVSENPLLYGIKRALATQGVKLSGIETWIELREISKNAHNL